MVKRFEVFSVLCSLATLLVSLVNARISCKSDDGQDVSRFFIYKLPEGARSMKPERVFDGTDYLYLDSTMWTFPPRWKRSPWKIYSTESALTRTVFPLTAAASNREMAYVIYNDAVEGKPQYGGHTKGIIMCDKESGVWLIHSVPSFPQNLEKHSTEYPESGEKFGQIAFCFTFPTSELEKIATHLRLQRPAISAARADSLFWNDYSNLNALVGKDFSVGDQLELRDNITGLFTTYRSFSKSPRYQKDVYLDLVAPDMDYSLLVSSWRRNGKYSTILDSHCHGSYTIENIVELTFYLGPEGWVKVKNTSDHSKWAISKDPGTNLVCVGTLNRVTSQFERGGETLCFKDAMLHTLLKATVTSYECCRMTEEEKRKPYNRPSDHKEAKKSPPIKGKTKGTIRKNTAAKPKSAKQG